MCLDDVPFNLSVPGIVGRGRIKHRNFAMASGEMSRGEFTSFLTETLGRASVEEVTNYVVTQVPALTDAA